MCSKPKHKTKKKEHNLNFFFLIQTIITKTGIEKLFVIRGRVIDTRIQFHYYTLKNNISTTIINYHGDNDNYYNEEDIDLMKNHKFKLRFKPFTIFGGICTPAIG